MQIFRQRKTVIEQRSLLQFHTSDILRERLSLVSVEIFQALIDRAQLACEFCYRRVYINSRGLLRVRGAQRGAIHHIDVNYSNNTLENLQLFCSNCHQIAHIRGHLDQVHVGVKTYEGALCENVLPQNHKLFHAIVKRANDCCETCGLIVHVQHVLFAAHAILESLKFSIHVNVLGSASPNDYTLLCNTCHEAIHNKEIVEQKQENVEETVQ